MFRCSMIIGLFLVGATSAAAQQPSTCSYLSCGLLRVEQDILAGQQRDEVASFGLFSPPDLRGLFQASDSAMHQLDIAEANYRSGKVLTWVGAALVVGGRIIFETSDEPGSSPSTGEWIGLSATLTGAGFTFWGAHRVQRARRAVDQGIWWYNETLRGGAP